MLRREPLFSALDRQLLSSGLQPDLHSLQGLLWELAENVTFFSGKVVRRTPAALVFPVIDDRFAIRGLSQQQATNGTRWLWFAFGSSIFRWYGPTPEVIANLVGFRADETATAPAVFYDFTHYGDWTLINNSSIEVAPQLFKPGVGAMTFGNAPLGVAMFRKKLNFMMAFGYGARGTRIGWSDADNIEEWTASKTTLAGSVSIEEMDTRIKTAVPLGSAIAVYAEDQMGLVNYISAPYYFGAKLALDGIGASGKFSVASDGKSNYGVGRAGIWWTDGLSYRYIDEGFLHDYLQEQVNWNQQSKIVACRNDYTGCFEFSFPMRSALEPNEAWCFDPRTGGWSKIPAFSFKDERRLFGKPILGTSDGKVMRDQDNVDGAAPLALRTKPLLAGEGLTVHTAVRIDEVVLLLKQEQGVQFRLGSSHHVEGPYVWSDWIDCSPGAATYQSSSYPPDGVYYKLDFRSIVNNWAFDLQGFMLYGSVEGSKRDVA